MQLNFLDYEQPIAELEAKIDELRYMSNDTDLNITEEIQKLKDELYQILASHTGNTFKKIEKDSDRNYWMTAEEAKEWGHIDEIVANRNKVEE